MFMSHVASFNFNNSRTYILVLLYTSLSKLSNNDNKIFRCHIRESGFKLTIKFFETISRQWPYKRTLKNFIVDAAQQLRCIHTRMWLELESKNCVDLVAGRFDGPAHKNVRLSRAPINYFAHHPAGIVVQPHLDRITTPLSG